MGFPNFTSTEVTPITIRKNTLLTGAVFSNQAMRVDYSVPDAGTSTGFPVSAFVSFQIGTSCTVADATLLYLYAGFETAPSGSSRILRLDDNGTYPADSFIELNCVANGAYGPAYVLKTGSPTGNAFGIGKYTSEQNGWLTVQLGTNTRYIALHSTLT